MAPDDPVADQEQIDNSIEIILKNFRSRNVSQDDSVIFSKNNIIFFVIEYYKGTQWSYFKTILRDMKN